MLLIDLSDAYPLFCEGQITGKPKASFPLPWITAKESVSSDAEMGNERHDPERTAPDVQSQPLDYDFQCYFLYTKRSDLYRRLDLRCEQMLTGTPRYHDMALCRVQCNPAPRFVEAKVKFPKKNGGKKKKGKKSEIVVKETIKLFSASRDISADKF